MNATPLRSQGTSSTVTPGLLDDAWSEYFDKPPRNLETHITKPFNALDSKEWLNNRSERDVYKLLIDSFRLREDDEYNFRGDISTDSVYDGGSNSVVPFKRFLRAAERQKVLPAWWSAEKAKECIAAGKRESNWSNLCSALDMSDVNEHYGTTIYMQLRIYAEQALGNPVGPKPDDHDEMWKQMVAMEEGSSVFKSMYSILNKR